jgi:hypothetical protein
MDIIINDVTFTFTYINRIFHKYNYTILINNNNKHIDSDKLIEFIKYSMILGVEIPYYRIDIVSKIDNYFEIIDLSCNNKRFYYGVLINILINIKLELFNYILNIYKNYITYLECDDDEFNIFYFFIMRIESIVKKNLY